MDGIANHFPANNALDCRILHTHAQNFPGSITPDFCRSAPGAWTQTPISAWLASVPIVPVLRNDHRSLPPNVHAVARIQRLPKSQNVFREYFHMRSVSSVIFIFILSRRWKLLTTLLFTNRIVSTGAEFHAKQLASFTILRRYNIVCPQTWRRYLL